MDRFVNLTAIHLDSVDGATAYGGNRQYAIWDDVLVYQVDGDRYYPTSLSLVTDGSYSLTGYYDKDQSQGGRIRVILAR